MSVLTGYHPTGSVGMDTGAVPAATIGRGRADPSGRVPPTAQTLDAKESPVLRARIYRFRSRSTGRRNVGRTAVGRGETGSG